MDNDVRYGIADCRKRLRSQRATTLRTQHPNPTDGSSGEKVSARGVESYAEILATVSMSQNSLNRLVECLLDPVENTQSQSSEVLEREEAVIT